MSFATHKVNSEDSDQTGWTSLCAQIICWFCHAQYAQIIGNNKDSTVTNIDRPNEELRVYDATPLVSEL